MGPTELARRINTSKQNVYGIFNRTSIDTALLTKLSRVLDFDFFAYYSPKGSTRAEEAKGYFKRSKRGKSESEDEIVRMRRELADLREKYELLRALYEAKTGRKVPGSVLA